MRLLHMIARALTLLVILLTHFYGFERYLVVNQLLHRAELSSGFFMPRQTNS